MSEHPIEPDKVLVPRDAVEEALEVVRCDPSYNHSSRGLQRTLEQCLGKGNESPSDLGRDKTKWKVYRREEGGDVKIRYCDSLEQAERFVDRTLRNFTDRLYRIEAPDDHKGDG